MTWRMEFDWGQNLMEEDNFFAQEEIKYSKSIIGF